jgi:hypothetical protein
MERGWDPDVKRFLLKVLNSLSLGLAWLIACATAGIYFKLGYRGNRPFIYTIFFYTGMLTTLFFLLRYLYNTWKKEKEL